MNQNAPLATAVLISLPGEGANAPSILGKVLHVRQVEYAAAQGCEKVILLGRGSLSDAIAIRHATEDAGLKLIEISGPHALAAAVAPDESLLVLQSNLLPAWEHWTDCDIGEGTILILPATAGREAGFERIDLARAWAGALVIPGKDLTSLHELPEDAEAAPALLRIALQARLVEHLLDESVLGDGSWFAVSSSSDLVLIEDQWLTRHAKPPADSSCSDLISGLILSKARNFLFSHGRMPALFLLLSVILATAGVAAAFYHQGVAGIGLLAGASFVHSFALVAKRLREVPSVRPTYWLKTRFLFDLAFLAVGFLSIDGSPTVRIFAPFVLLASLHSGPVPTAVWQVRIRDRAFVFALTAVAGIFIGAMSAIMLLSTALLALNLLSRYGRKG